MTRYIRKNNDSYNIIKNSRNYGKFTNPDDAILIRDELIKKDWDLGAIDEVYIVDDEYVTVKVIDDKAVILDRSKTKPSDDKIRQLYLKRLRNPNNSRYGLNITKIFDTYIIKKRIAGDDYIFGYYDRLEDAEFVRNYLLEHNWNVNEFSNVMFDEETSTYNAVEVIDDKVYILGVFDDENINIDKARSQFLNMISKHKLGLAQHPYLDELTDKIPELEEKFNLKTEDDVWDLNKTDSLEIIFSLTPFQKSVYDAVNDSTFEDIKKSLARFRSKNFDEKIQKNIDDLINMNLIEKNQDYYKKR